MSAARTPAADEELRPGPARRIGVLISGRGSNLKAILAACSEAASGKKSCIMAQQTP